MMVLPGGTGLCWYSRRRLRQEGERILGRHGIHRPTRGLADVDAELEQFPMDARCTPQRIGVTHAPDQITSFWTDPVAIPDDVIANANRTGNPCDATQSRLRA
jgi:hypothetical protein